MQARRLGHGAWDMGDGDMGLWEDGQRAGGYACPVRGNRPRLLVA